MWPGEGYQEWSPPHHSLASGTRTHSLGMGKAVVLIGEQSNPGFPSNTMARKATTTLYTDKVSREIALPYLPLLPVLEECVYRSPKMVTSWFKDRLEKIWLLQEIIFLASKRDYELIRPDSVISETLHERGTEKQLCQRPSLPSPHPNLQTGSSNLGQSQSHYSYPNGKFKSTHSLQHSKEKVY